MTLFLLCLKIFFARITDVTLGTIRTVYTVRGRSILSGLIAFFEVFIWFLVVKEALNTPYHSIFIVVSYSLGYATGTIIGTSISKRFINSLISVEVITSKYSKENLKLIRENGYGVSVVDTINNYEDQKQKILYITLNSRYLNELKSIIKKIDEKAFIVINENYIVQNGFIK